MGIINQELKGQVINQESDNQVFFYNSIFSVQKKRVKWQKILECRIFNRQIQVESFKMEGVRENRDIIQQANYATSPNLHKSYHHFAVPIQIRSFLDFYFEKKSYRYIGMSFGVAVASRIFTKTLMMAITEIRKRWKEI
ncbi:MAG: hypothetical protein EZS28_003796 [Streblomastix strix]|uniref:Uncharacterized protein n=1 Tax=Streblomastix strix TaxID=222440 RepID=A0A5J4X1Z6_9EUKA|nr:MAG: hypothetical protein EZS28_003796 [Streblomastix strix]